MEVERVNFSITHKVDNKTLDTFIHSIKPKKWETIWDFACGYGAISKHLLKTTQIDTIILEDISTFQLKRAKINLKEKRKTNNLTFIKSPLQELPFENETFDKIYLKMWLHELPLEDQKKALSEIYRVLKTDWEVAIRDLTLPPETQKLIQTIIRKKDTLAWFDTQVTNRYFFTQQELEQNAQKAGFQNIKHISDIYYRFATKDRLDQEFKWDRWKLDELNNFFRNQVNKNLTQQQKDKYEYEEDGQDNTLIRFPKKMFVLKKH